MCSPFRPPVKSAPHVVSQCLGSLRARSSRFHYFTSYSAVQTRSSTTSTFVDTDVPIPTDDGSNPELLLVPGNLAPEDQGLRDGLTKRLETHTQEAEAARFPSSGSNGKERDNGKASLRIRRCRSHSTSGSARGALPAETPSDLKDSTKVRDEKDGGDRGLETTRSGQRTRANTANDRNEKRRQDRIPLNKVRYGGQSTASLSSLRSRASSPGKVSNLVHKVESKPHAWTTPEWHRTPKRAARNLAMRREKEDKVQRIKDHLRQIKELAAMTPKRTGFSRQPSQNATYNALEGIGNALDIQEGASEGFQDDSSDPFKGADWNDLPLSPLMHPGLLKARKQYHEKKPLPSQDPSEFEAKLARNPYAQLLATPVRACRITNARLPSAFLTRFILLRHPQFGNLWQLPESYHPSMSELSFVDKFGREGSESEDTAASNSTKDTVEDIVRPNKDQPDSTIQDTSEPTEEDPVADVLSNEASKIAVKSQNQLLHHYKLSGSYMLATRSTMDAVLRLPRKKMPNIFPARWRERYGRELTKDGHWRPDMGLFIHKLIQNKVRRLLAYLERLDSYYVEPLNPDHMSETLRGWTRSENPFKPGMALLWLGPDRPVAADYFSDFIRVFVEERTCSAEVLDQSGNCVLLYSRQGHTLPVFNLQGLLGDAGVAWLRERASTFQHTEVLVSGKQRTAEFVGWLWRLVGYGNGDEGSLQVEDNATAEGSGDGEVNGESQGHLTANKGDEGSEEGNKAADAALSS